MRCHGETGKVKDSNDWYINGRGVFPYQRLGNQAGSVVNAGIQSGGAVNIEDSRRKQQSGKQSWPLEGEGQEERL